MTITETIVVSFKICEEYERLKEFEKTKSDDWVKTVSSSMVTYKKSKTLSVN